MTEQDRIDVAKGLLVLGETFNEPVTQLRAEAYFDALADLPIAVVLRAMKVAVRNARFFPRPAEIRDHATGEVQDRAELAWLCVVQLVRRMGYYQQPVESDWPDGGARRAALELFGGWRALCEHLPIPGTPEFLGTAKQFKAAYGAYARRDNALPAGEPERELSAADARAALGNLKAQLTARGLPTGNL